MSHNKARNLLVFDIEGEDSKMLCEKRQVRQMAMLTFLQRNERMASLFALAVADVLIINMRAHDVVD